MSKASGGTRTVSSANAAASRTFAQSAIGGANVMIKNISGLSDVKDNNSDVTINGTMIFGNSKVEKLRGNIPKEEYMKSMQNVLISLNPSFIKQIDKMNFKNKDGGVYTIDTKIGGGQIEQNESIFGNITYTAKVWNATYNFWKDKEFSTLNAAKAYVKDKLKGK